MRKSTNSDQYFAEKEEKAVVDYIRSDSVGEKNKIYNEILYEPFNKMIQSILRRYPVHIGNYAIEEVEENALTHLIEKMVTFDPDRITKTGKKTKAFSYCQTIIRNYYKDHSTKSYAEKIGHLCFEDYSDEIENRSDYQYENEDDDTNMLDKLLSNVITEIVSIIELDKSLKRNEIIVGEAIVNILQNWDRLFTEESPDGKYNKRVTNKFEKNKILFYIKEQTELTTKEIRAAIKPFKIMYFSMKDSYLSEE